MGQRYGVHTETKYISLFKTHTKSNLTLRSKILVFLRKLGNFSSQDTYFE